MSFQDLEAGRPLIERRDLISAKEDPIHVAASGIFQINTAVSTFQRLVNILGTPKDTPELREKLHKTSLLIRQLMKDTSKKLNQASEMDHHADVSILSYIHQIKGSKKITTAKLAKDFQAVLREFQKAERLAAERETTDTPFIPQAASPSSYSDEVNRTADKNLEQHAALVAAKRQEVLLLNEASRGERELGTKEIQQQMREVNQIFQDLAVLVHEQSAMIDETSSRIENSHATTLQGRSHLVKISDIQRSNSSLTCLLVVIFGIVLLIVIIVLVA